MHTALTIMSMLAWFYIGGSFLLVLNAVEHSNTNLQIDYYKEKNKPVWHLRLIQMVHISLYVIWVGGFYFIL